MSRPNLYSESDGSWAQSISHRQIEPANQYHVCIISQWITKANVKCRDATAGQNEQRWLGGASLTKDVQSQWRTSEHVTARMHRFKVSKCVDEKYQASTLVWCHKNLNWPASRNPGIKKPDVYQEILAATMEKGEQKKTHILPAGPEWRRTKSICHGQPLAATEMAGRASPRAHAEQYRVNSTRQIRLDGFGLLGKE